MLKEERQKKILEKLSNKSKINLDLLAKDLGVSYDSIRRDVIELEDKGLLKKVHGGVISNSYFNQLSQVDEMRTSPELKIIVKKALKLISKNQTLLLDGGTSNIYLASQIPKDIPLTVITNNLLLAMILNDHEKVNVILIGGTYYKRYFITKGSEAVQSLDNFNADLYFMGVNGIHPKNGITIRNYEESILKQKMMEISKKTIVSANDEKINNVEAFKICDLNDIQVLISNLKNDNMIFSEFGGIEII